MQKAECVKQVALVDVDVGKEKRDTFERDADFSRHQVKMVNVGRQPEIGIAAALVGRHYEQAVLYLKLYQRQARLLVGLRAGFAKKQDIVFALTHFLLDFLHKCRKLAEIGRITIDKLFAAIILPHQTRTTGRRRLHHLRFRQRQLSAFYASTRPNTLHCHRCRCYPYRVKNVMIFGSK